MYTTLHIAYAHNALYRFTTRVAQVLQWKRLAARRDAALTREATAQLASFGSLAELLAELLAFARLFLLCKTNTKLLDIATSDWTGR